MLNIKGKRKNRDYGDQGSLSISTKCYQYQEKTKSQENEREYQDEEKKKIIEKIEEMQNNNHEFIKDKVLNSKLS